MKKLFGKKKINLAQYSEENTVIETGEAFENMTKLISKKLEYTAEYEEFKSKMEEKFESLHKISRIDIPELAKALGQMLFKLPDGTQVEITSKLEANPAKKNMPRIYRWLEKMGAGSLIKNTITLDFDRTPDGQKDFEFAEEALREKGIAYNKGQSLHKATLEKHLKECREKGIQIDEKLVGLYDVYDTVINGVKTPKKGK